MSDARHRLRILHISDLHARSSAGPNPEKEPARRYRVLAEAWDRNLAQLLQDGPIDLVCFTGDAADWGLHEEYEEAGRFLETLLTRLGVGRDRLFVIPGNHDIQRKVREDVWKAFRERAPRADRLELSRWMAGLSRQPPLGFEDAWRDQILERQSAYRSWVRDGLGRPELDPGGPHHGRLGYRATLQLPGLTFPVHVIGLDTSWLCGNDADTNHLRLTDSQVLNLASGADGKPLPGLRLALLHHPFHELADGAHCRKLVSDFTDLSLRGHLHRTEVQAGVFPDPEPRILASGCLFEGDQADLWGNACQVLTLSLDDQGRPDRLDLRFRAFSSDGGHWYDDGSIYEKASSGRLSWTFPRPTPSILLSNLYDPWTPAVPPRFVGREDLLRRLEAAMEEGRSVSVVGDWRIGKSSLLQTWHEKQRGSGREVRLLSGEGPEGVSPRAFVEKVTGWRSGEGADEAADILDCWAGSVGRPGLVPLMLVDEFDGIVPRFEHRFLERLRGMLGRIAFVLASRRELDLIYEELGRTSPFHNRLELMWVGLLDEAAAEALIASGAGTLPGGVELMRLWAGRHPFYLQLLGRCLQDAAKAGESRQSALDRFRSEAAIRLRELWRVLGERDRDGLLSVLSGSSPNRRSLRTRGLATEEGKIFGKVLEDWLQEEL